MNSRLLWAVSVFLVIVLPLIAQASFLTIVSSLFGDEENLNQTLPNSQKMVLLEGQGLASVSLSIGGGDITIVEGSTLVSDSNPAGQQASLLQEHGNSQISTYVVREGDTISQIANMFGVSVNTIRWGNNISGNTISPGQTLVILPISGVRHTIKSGETLAGIAKLYKGEVKEIIAFNDIGESDKLATGQVIIVPDGVLPSGTKGSSGSKGGASQPTYEGYYQRPIAGGRRSQGIHGFNGVDLATSQGANILAAASGVVTVSRGSGWNGGYGNYIVISHPNGTQTLYAHTSSNLVGAGERVEQGQVIGYVGSTGRSTGPHVHFEIRGAKNPF